MKKPWMDKLTEGLNPEQRDALGDLTDLANRLKAYTVPQPEPEETAELVDRLSLLLLSPADSDHPAGLTASETFQQWLRLAWSQTTLLEAPFWWASGLVVLIGLILGLSDQGGLLATIFVLLAPALAAAGVGYAFRPATRCLWELERLTPINPFELLYARMALILGLNGVTALLLLLVVSIQAPQFVIWRLVCVWLGPMLALSGLALYATVRWGSLAGTILPLGIWAGLVLVGWQQAMANASVTTSAMVWLQTFIRESNTLLAGSGAAMVLGLTMLLLTSRTIQKGELRWN